MASGTVAWDIVARDHASDAFKKVSKSADDTNSSLKRLKDGATTAGTPFGKLGQAASSAIPELAGLTAGVGAITAIATKSVDAYVGLADQVREFAARSGASADEASRFVAVMDDYSISAEAGEKALFKLAQNVTTNEEGLRALGLTAARTKDGQADLVGTFENLADAYQRTTDPGKRAQLVMSALGKSGADLIPLLEQGGQGVRDLFADVPKGQIFDDAQLRQALDFKLAVDDMHDAVQEVEIQIGEVLVPTLGEMASNVAVVVRGLDDLTRAVGLKGGAAEAFGFLWRTANPVGMTLNALAAVTKQLDPSAADAAKSEADLARSLADIGDEGGPAVASMDAIAKAQQSAIDATFAFGDSQAKLKDDQQAVADAQRDYQDALNGTGKYADAQTAATERLQSAQESLLQTQRRIRDLTESVGDKQAALTEAVFHYGSGSKQAQDAARDLRDSQESLGDAQAEAAKQTDAVKKAQDELARTRDLSDARRDAADKLADAERNLTRDVYNTAKANVELGIKMGEANGQTFTATQQAALLRAEIEKLRDTNIPADSPLMSSLGAIVGLLTPAGQSAFEKFRAGERASGEQAPFGTGGGGVWDQPASPTTGTTTPGTHAAGGNTIVFNYPVPPDQVAAYVESTTRTPY